MFNQLAKRLKVTAELPWRKPSASLNDLLASHVWQQMHNGFTLQDPGFIDHVVNKKTSVVRVYLPPDAFFTKDKHVIFAFHGYPWLIHRLTYRPEVAKTSAVIDKAMVGFHPISHGDRMLHFLRSEIRNLITESTLHDKNRQLNWLTISHLY